MFQDTDLPMLPPHLRDSFLRPRVYSQFEFQIFFSEIWDSGISDLISRNQQIRVVNYTKWMAMRETRMCLTCEGKWCEDHECQNSCLVLFNPYDRDHEFDEVKDQELEENSEVEMQLDTCSWEKTNSLHESSTDPVIEGESENVVLGDVPMFEGSKVCNDKPDREPQQDIISSGQFYEADSVIKVQVKEDQTGMNDDELEGSECSFDANEAFCMDLVEFEVPVQDIPLGSSCLFEGEVSSDFSVEFQVKKEFKEKLLTPHDWKEIDRMLERELGQNTDEGCEAEMEYIEEVEPILSQPSVKDESGKIQEVSIFNGVKVLDEKSEWKLEQDLILSGRFFKTDSPVQFKQIEVRNYGIVAWFGSDVEDELGKKSKSCSCDGHVVDIGLTFSEILEKNELILSRFGPKELRYADISSFFRKSHENASFYSKNLVTKSSNGDDIVVSKMGLGSGKSVMYIYLGFSCNYMMSKHGKKSFIPRTSYFSLLTVNGGECARGILKRLHICIVERMACGYSFAIKTPPSAVEQNVFFRFSFDPGGHEYSNEKLNSEECWVLFRRYMALMDITCNV